MTTGKSLLIFLAFLNLLEIGSTATGDYELKGARYPLLFFPFLDRLDIEQVFGHKSYMRLLLKCVFFEGKCDMIGKWLKPRAIAALFGTCLVCTDQQKRKMEGWLLLLVDKNPKLFRAAMIKVCYDMELPIQPEEFNQIKTLLKP